MYNVNLNLNNKQMKVSQPVPNRQGFSSSLNNKDHVSFGASPSTLIKNSIEYIPREKLLKELEILQVIDKEMHEKVIKSIENYAAEKFGKRINIQELKNGGSPEITDIPIGKGGVALFARRFKDFLLMPINAVKFFLVKIKNLVVHPDKVFSKKKPAFEAKKALKQAETTEFTPIFTKNIIGLIEKSSKDMGIPVEDLLHKVGNDPTVTRKFKETYGEYLADLLSGEKASYDASTASTWFKMTALMTIPLKVIDAYNVAQTKDGDASQSIQRAKERLGQDLTRHGLSTWITAGFNTIFRELGNKSILGSSLVAGTQTVVSEILTRVVAGNAVLPKTRDQLVEMEDNTLGAKGFKGDYYRFMSSITGRKPLRELVSNNRDCLLKNGSPNTSLFTSTPKNQSPSKPSSSLAERLNIDPALIPERLRNS